MPNWCNNTLTIQGESKDVERFAKKLHKIKNKDDKIEDLLKAFVPMPKEWNPDDWYGWNCDNWGTKWDILCHYDEIEKEHIILEFDSAWSPPIQWLEIVAKKYPKLKFSLKYDEPGMAFMGCAKGTNGIIEDSCIEY